MSVTIALSVERWQIMTDWELLMQMRFLLAPLSDATCQTVSAVGRAFLGSDEYYLLSLSYPLLWWEEKLIIHTF